MKPAKGTLDMVRWDDGTHEIMSYNDDNGYGLTRCGKRIGPWDAWLVGKVTCKECKTYLRRHEREEKHGKEKGPRDWFPERKDGLTVVEAEAKVKDLEKKIEDLYEVLTPFVLHGKALGALKRDDITTIVSQKDSSYLCIGAFQLLMEAVDPEYFGLKRG
jgi:hypothetical protein